MPLILCHPYTFKLNDFNSVTTKLLMSLTGLTNNKVVDSVTGAGVTSPFSRSEIALSTEKAKSGTTSLKTTAKKDVLYTAQTTPFYFPGDFTIEFFAYPTEYFTGNLFNIGGMVNVSWQSQSMYVDGTGYLHYCAFSNPSTGGNSPSTTIANEIKVSKPMILDAWNHVAITRQGNQYSVYLNGERVLAITSSLTPFQPTYYTMLANFPTSSQLNFADQAHNFNGYIDNWRVTKGVARYAGATYSVPVTPFGTTVATDPSWNSVTSFIDFETKNASQEPVDAKLGAWVFSREAAKAYVFKGLRPQQDLPALYCGPGTQTLNAPSPVVLGTDDFTAEIWYHSTTADGIYKNLFGNRKRIFETTSGFSVGVINSQVYCYADKFLIPASGTLSKTTWNHIALVRQNGMMTLYLNGVAVGNYSATVYNFTDAIFGVGSDPVGTSNQNTVEAYLSDFCISTGAKYEANFTPSSVPITVVT